MTLEKDLKEETERCHFWEKTAKRYRAESKYYQEQLVDAHTLIGRITHQLSERWDKVRLTKYYPTDNLWGRRTIDNPSGEKIE